MQEPVAIPLGISKTLEGFEDLLCDQGGPQDGTEDARARTEGGTDAASGGPQGGTAGFVSVEEAADRLGISQRAVLKRLAKGTLIGQKIAGKTKERWIVDLSSLPSSFVHVDICDQGGPQDRTEDAQARTEGGTDSAPGGPQGGTAVSSSYADAYLKLVQVVEKQTEIIQQLSQDLRTKDMEIRLLTDSQHKEPAWWHRFCSWIKP